MKLKIKIICLALISIVILYLVIPKSVNSYLGERNIPKIPSYNKLVGIESGGLFASWLFISVEADKNQIDGYRSLLIDGKYKFQSIGSDDKSIKIIKLEDYKADEVSIQNIKFKERLNGKYISWWNTDLVKTGEIIEGELPNSCGFYVILAPENNRIYIYWHYS